MAQVTHGLEKRFVAWIPGPEEVGHVEVAEACGDSDYGGDSDQKSVACPIMRSSRAVHMYVIGVSARAHKKQGAASIKNSGTERCECRN